MPLAPLHQPNNLAPIREIRAATADLRRSPASTPPSTATIPRWRDRYAIPDELYRAGVRRYGFHGLSYEYVAARPARSRRPSPTGGSWCCHLGSGASMCAIHGGRSIDSTMGFTAVDGLPMGTRTGQLDPGVVLYLVQNRGYGAEEIERFLYHDGGLKGLSGVSNDMRDLVASDDRGRAAAIDYFVYRIARETGALAAAMGGIDGLVFTAGIGERSAAVRGARGRAAELARVRARFSRQREHALVISTPASRLQALVVPTNEELMIARHALRLVRGADGPSQEEATVEPASKHHAGHGLDVLAQRAVVVEERGRPRVRWRRPAPAARSSAAGGAARCPGRRRSAPPRAMRARLSAIVCRRRAA